MGYLTDLLGGKPENELERAVDRAFLNMSIHRAVGSFFDPERRKRKLEEQLLERSLTSDSLPDKIGSGLYMAASIHRASKDALRALLT